MGYPQIGRQKGFAGAYTNVLAITVIAMPIAISSRLEIQIRRAAHLASGYVLYNTPINR